jgi:Carbohydrate binding domain/Right handed beta helix region
MRYLITIGLLTGFLTSSALAQALKETNAVPFDPSFETNLWGIAQQPEWVFNQTIHVDNQSPIASDANSGSSDSPLMTISKAVERSSPGSRILIYPGTYRESVKVTPAKSGTPLAPLMFEAKEYGKVTLSGSDVVTDWTQDGNRYYATWTNNWGVSADEWAAYGASVSELGRRREMVFVDGTFYWQKLSHTNLTAGTFAVDEATDRIYIRMADSSVPSDHQIEVSMRSMGLSLGDPWTQSAWASNVVVRGITFQHFEKHSFVGRHVLVEDCKMLWNNSSCTLGGEDYIFRRVTCLFNGICAMSILPRTGFHDVNGLIENCTTSYGNWRYGKMGGQDGFGMAGMKVMMLKNLIIRGHVSQWNYCPGIWMDCLCNNVLVEDSLLTDNRTQGLWVEICNGENVVRNNVMANNGNGILISHTSYLRIYGNIFYNNGTQIGNWHMNNEEIRDGWRTVGLKIYDNVMYGANSVSLPAFTSLWSTIEVGGNLYYPAVWTAQGHDGTSTAGDPLFVSPSMRDFRVKSGSPLLMNSKWSFVEPSLSYTGTLSLEANRSDVIRYSCDGNLPVSASTSYSTPLDLSAFDGDIIARRYGSVLTGMDTNYCPPVRTSVSQGQRNIIVNPGFEMGSPIGWGGFGCTVSNVSLLPRSGAYCGRVSGRTATWNGPSIALNGKLVNGATYKISAWVRLASPGSTNISLTISQTDSAGVSYHSVASVTASNSAWTKTEGLFTLNVNGTLTGLLAYWNGPEAKVEYFIDDAVCTPVIEGSLPRVLNTGASGQSSTSITLSGSLTNGSIADAWICWGDKDGGTGGTNNWDHVVPVGCVNQGAPFNVIASGLDPNRTYWYRCYVVNEAGMGWSSVASSFSGTGSHWTPSNLVSMALWLDASTATRNAGTVSVVNAGSDGGTISGPASLGFNDISNLQTIQFNGIDQYLIGNYTNTKTTLTAFFVGKQTTASQTSFAAALTVWGNGQTFDWNNVGSAVLLSQNGTNANSLYTHRNATLSSQTGTLTSPFLAETLFNGSTNTVYINGIPAAGVASAGSFNTAKVMLGARWKSSAISAPYWKGSFGETIICNTNLNTSDRQKIEGYLAWKWGMQSNLPAGHLYKNTLPFSGGAIAVLSPTGVTASAATFNASLVAAATNYDVYVYYGTSDGGTNPGSWANSTYVGSWTNVELTNISYSVSGLTADTMYYCTFLASNATTTAWATPSWRFATAKNASVVTVNHAVPHTWLSNRNSGWASDYEAAVTNDADGDGFSTWQEYWSGTDPQNSDSFIRIQSITQEGGEVVITWENDAVGAGLPPLAIQARTNLLSGTWTKVGQQSIVNGINAWSNASSQQLFYRLAVTNTP